MGSALAFVRDEHTSEDLRGAARRSRDMRRDVFDLEARSSMVVDAREHVGEPGARIGVVGFGGLDHRHLPDTGRKAPSTRRSAVDRMASWESLSLAVGGLHRLDRRRNRDAPTTQAPPAIRPGHRDPGPSPGRLNGRQSFPWPGSHVVPERLFILRSGLIDRRIGNCGDRGGNGGDLPSPRFEVSRSPGNALLPVLGVLTLDGNLVRLFEAPG